MYALSFVLSALAAFVALVPPAGASPEPTRGAIASVRGCDVGYVLRGPAPGEAPLTAIVAHGFLRNGDFMQGWAEAIAREGIAAVTVDLCASSAMDGRHADNGADLVALRRSLGVRDVVYVGVSAGGLAALIAGSLDPGATRGLLLLDPVNAGGQARSAAGKVRAPVAALVAKSQVCNAWRNIDPALAALADATTVRVPDASHCDFEWPSDGFCRVACLDTHSSDERERAQQRIREVSLDYLRALARGPDALPAWRGSIGPDQLR